MIKTYEELRTELQENYPMVEPYHYWIISSPLIYPSVCVYNDESTRVFSNDNDADMKRVNDIKFEDCTVYQCDGLGGADCEGKDLGEFVELEQLDIRTYKIRFVFDCTQYGSFYRTIHCTEDNFSEAYKHQLMLARNLADLHYDEPSLLLSKEDITEGENE